MLVRYRRFLHSISYIDIKGVRYRRSLYSISKVKNRLYRRSKQGCRYRSFVTSISNIIIRYRALISTTISKAFLTFDIEGHVIKYRVRYRIRYSIHPISFTAERKLPLPRLHHACAEESQRHDSPRALDSCTLFLRNSTA